MKLRTKIAILLVSIAISFVQFNLIVSCTCCVQVLKIAKKAKYQMISNVLAIERDSIVKIK